MTYENTDTYKLPEIFENKCKALTYPKRPEKPVKLDSESNRAFGERLDDWDVEIEKYKVAQKEYREKSGQIDDEFRDAVVESLGLKNHPKAGLLFSKAWEHGHSAGYSEVVIWAVDLAELLED